eukprot:302325_1
MLSKHGHYYNFISIDASIQLLPLQWNTYFHLILKQSTMNKVPLGLYYLETVLSDRNNETTFRRIKFNYITVVFIICFHWIYIILIMIKWKQRYAWIDMDKMETEMWIGIDKDMNSKKIIIMILMPCIDGKNKNLIGACFL